MNRFVPIPAIDIRDGRVVRLRQGEYSHETRYGDDPVGLAMRYATEGAAWLHLVDLDAARAGGFGLVDMLGRLVADGRLSVQAGGGVRSAAHVQAMLDAGASRVVIGSLAVEHPEEVARWMVRFGSDRIVLALDVRLVGQRWIPASRGWTQASDTTLETLLCFYGGQGLAHLLCTDIARDGMLTGPNLPLYRHVRAIAPQVALQASGGIRNEDDIARVREVGCSGVVLGRALLEGAVTVKQAVAC